MITDKLYNFHIYRGKRVLLFYLQIDQFILHNQSLLQLRSKTQCKARLYAEVSINRNGNFVLPFFQCNTRESTQIHQ